MDWHNAFFVPCKKELFEALMLPRFNHANYVACSASRVNMISLPSHLLFNTVFVPLSESSKYRVRERFHRRSQRAKTGPYDGWHENSCDWSWHCWSGSMLLAKKIWPLAYFD